MKTQTTALVFWALLCGQAFASPLVVATASQSFDEALKAVGQAAKAVGSAMTTTATAVTASIAKDVAGVKARQDHMAAEAKKVGDAVASGVQGVVAGVSAAMKSAAEGAAQTTKVVSSAVTATSKAAVAKTVNDLAEITDLDWNKGLVTPTDFKVNGKCNGNGYCFPVYNPTQISDPQLGCEQGYKPRLQVAGAGDLVCTKETNVTETMCFRSLKCPVTSKDVGKDCIDPKVVAALTRVLAAFKVRNALPLSILPSLGGAIRRAALLNPVLPFNSKTVGTALRKLGETGIDTVRGLVAAALDVDVSSVNSNPFEDLVKGLLALDSSDVLKVLPELESWATEALKGVLGVSRIVEDVSKYLPTCLYKCCSDVTQTESDIKAPKLQCPKGLKLDAFTLTCTGAEAAYAKCPKGMAKCAHKVAGRVVCIAQKKVWGLDSCSVLTAMDVAGQSVPRIACP